MATSYVAHHLYPDNPQLFIIDAKQIVKLAGEPSTSFWQHRRGELFWEVVIYTSGLDSFGNSLGPYWVDVKGSEQTVNELINEKIRVICSEIDWTKSVAVEEGFEAQADRYAPVIYWSYPAGGQVDVPIDCTVIIRLRDLLPAKGIDISTLVLKIGGYIVNPVVTGNKYDYVLSYKPQIGM